MLGLLTFAMNVAAQTATNLTVAGTVVDETGEGIPGANVFLKNRAGIGTSTDQSGKFTIKASKNDFIVVTYIGYKEQEILIQKDEPNLQIQLEISATEIEEVVVLGMGSQRKISSVAAVTSVDVSTLQTPTSSIANLLGGRVAGVISTLHSGEPGKNIQEFWIRGIGTFGYSSGALVLIDDLEGDINSVDPADIESFSVLKDASATAVYGVRGANGVILIKTKRGQTGKLKIDARVNYTLSHLKRMPEYLGAYDYALLANEAMIVRGENPLYQDIELYIIQHGLDPDMYPDVNWQKEILNTNSFRQSYYVSGQGGGEAARYFISLGGNTESSAYRQDKNSIYSSGVGYNQYNFRTNLDMTLTKSTRVFFGANGYLTILNEPGMANTDYLWEAQARLTPVLMPTRFSNGLLPASSGTTQEISPYVLLNNTGKRSSQNWRSDVTMKIEQDLSAITEGLNVTAQGAYNMSSNYTGLRFIMPATYRSLGRSANGELILKEMNQSRPATFSRTTSQSRKYYFESKLNWMRSFDDHRTSALVFYSLSDELESDRATNSMTSIPNRYQMVSSRLTYGFQDTYLIDFNFGFTGSENFEPGHQYGFFPSIAIGWVPSQYTWFTDALSQVNFFKLRGSYGSVGNDRISDRRFPYLTTLTTGTSSVWGSSSQVNTVNINQEGADNLQWESATKANLGVELKLFNSKFELTAELYKDWRDGIFQERQQIPQYVGLISLPYGNVGKMYSYGSDGNFSYIQNFSKDLDLTVRGNYSFSRNKIVNWEDMFQKYPYQIKSGWPLNIMRGFQALGLFKDEDDVKYSPTQSWNTVMPGDIKYRDVNGDGKINDDDKVPLSLDNFPSLQYGFGGEVRYKDYTLGLLFTGRGNQTFYRTQSAEGWGWIPFRGGETGNILSIVNDPHNRWIPKEYAEQLGIDPALAENPNAQFPRLYYGDNVNNRQISDFWQGNSRYLRLQEITLNYNLRHNAMRLLGIQSIDMQLIATNLYTWDNIKLFDPEQAERNGIAYPIPATFSIQLYIHL
jgi:TonB-linked SusC/RagA family outer membrane protein